MFLRRKFLSKVLRNDEGYSLQFVRETLVRYDDEAGPVFIGVERLASDSEFNYALYPDQMWINRDNNEKLADPARRALVLERLRAGFSHWKLSLDAGY